MPKYLCRDADFWPLPIDYAEPNIDYFSRLRFSMPPFSRVAFHFSQKAAARGFFSRSLLIISRRLMIFLAPGCRRYAS